MTRVMGAKRTPLDRVNRAVYNLATTTDALEQRLEEVDERTTALAIGQGAISAALDRTEALARTVAGLEARAHVLESVQARMAKVDVGAAVVLAGPARLWVLGQISAGRWAETLSDWLNGKRLFLPADFGLSAWPELPEGAEEDPIPW